MLGEPKMLPGVLTSGRKRVEHTCALQGPPKPARVLSGSPGIVPQDRPECLSSQLTSLRRQLVKKTIELKKLSREKSLIIGMAVHDLRNPIGGILNASDYLLGNPDGLAEDQLLLLRAISASSNFMLVLVDDIVQLAHDGGLRAEVGSRTHRPRVAGRTESLAKPAAGR
jgi:signal transduction histidine kinase